MDTSSRSDQQTSIHDFLAIPEEYLPRTLSRAEPGQLDAAIEDAPLGILLLDDQLRFRHLNQKARPIFAGLGEVKNKPWVEVLLLHWRAETAETVIQFARRALETGIGYSSLNFSDQRIDLKAEEVYHWDVHPVTLSDGTKYLACYFVGPLI